LRASSVEPARVVEVRPAGAVLFGEAELHRSARRRPQHHVELEDTRRVGGVAAERDGGEVRRRRKRMPVERMSTSPAELSPT
jgi:hypothetical protein